MGRVGFAEARSEAEERYPFLKQFSEVQIAATQVENKGGFGEFVGPDDPTNPLPGAFTITVGESSAGLQGGVADTIIADMVHAAGELSPEFNALRDKLVSSFSKEEIALARKRYEEDFKGKFSGTTFETFENFLRVFWAEGMVQHLLLPENSEIEQIREANPKAGPILDEIEALFKSDAGGGGDTALKGGVAEDIGTAFMIKREGFVATAKAPDKGDLATNGFGNTRGVKVGDTVTEAEATETVKKQVKATIAYLPSIIDVPLNDNQQAALASLILNVGRKRFSTSKALKALNRGDLDTFRKEAFDKVIGFVKQFKGGPIVPGLVNRRKFEEDLFFKDIEGSPGGGGDTELVGANPFNFLKALKAVKVASGTKGLLKTNKFKVPAGTAASINDSTFGKRVPIEIIEGEVITRAVVIVEVQGKDGEFMFFGSNHGEAFDLADSEFKGARGNRFGFDIRTAVSGFETSTGRIVSRDQAGLIAKANNQSDPEGLEFNGTLAEEMMGLDTFDEIISNRPEGLKITKVENKFFQEFLDNPANRAELLEDVPSFKLKNGILTVAPKDIDRLVEWIDETIVRDGGPGSVPPRLRKMKFFNDLDKAVRGEK